MPVAGKYRLIDIPISNCINSGCNRIYVLTQFLSVSLHRHIANTYKFDPFEPGLRRGAGRPADQRGRRLVSGHRRRRAPADPLRRRRPLPATSSSCPATSSTAWTSASCSRRTGEPGRRDHRRPARAARSGRRLRRRPPRRDGPRRRLRREAADRRGGRAAAHLGGVDALGAACAATAGRILASMGIYVFTRKALLDLLNARPLATDFGKEVFPRSIKSHRVSGPPVRRLLGGPGHRQGLPRGQPRPGRRRPALRLPQPRRHHLHAHAFPAGLAHERRPPEPDASSATAASSRPAPTWSAASSASAAGSATTWSCATWSCWAPTASRPTPSAPPTRRAACPDLVIGDDVRHRAGHPRQGVPHRPRRPDRQSPRRAERRGRQLRDPRRHRRHPARRRRPGWDGDLKKPMKTAGRPRSRVPQPFARLGRRPRTS